MRFIVLICAFAFSVPLIATAAEPSDVIQEEDKSAFKGLFYTVWNKFKSLSPKKDNVVRNTTVTMGIRGAETTSTILQPYWKDDKTNDKQFMMQLEDFAKAQTMADKGEVEAANKAYNQFIEQYPDSELKPNAQFAGALTLGAMGKTQESSQALKAFVEEHPNHPLAEDAELLMKEMQ